MSLDERLKARIANLEVLSPLPKEFQFVDAHHHLWNLSRTAYSWLKEHRDMEQYLGPYDEICRNYLVDDLKADGAPVMLIKSVHIETADPKNPVTETRWLQDMADQDSDGFPHGIVGAADLCAPDVDEVLAQHCEFPNFRGIRALIFRDPSFSYLDSFRDGLKLLCDRELTFDTDTDWQHMPMYSDIARNLPDLQMVLNHCGFPKYRTTAYFNSWRVAISEFAKNENVTCKISGLGMVDHRWSLDSIRPWVETCLESFGIDRCIFATNWPVDSLFSSYQEAVRSYHHIVRDFSLNERDKLFRRNAERVYRI